MFAIGTTVYLVYGNYVYSRDIDAWIDRAQVAGDMGDIREYLGQLKENMEEKGMTQGHFALIFTTPANDLSLHYKSVCRLIERIDDLETRKLSKSDTAYQVAMDDIRGVIRELENPGTAYFWSRWWNVLLPIMALLAVLLVVFMVTIISWD